jgi:DNA-3-methyladenine glycosylase II
MSTPRRDSTVLNPATIQKAHRHLRSADPVMRRLIDAVGPFTLRPRWNRRFSVLARAIISQQVSTAAARRIRGKLETLVDHAQLTAERVTRLTEEQLRSVGLSRQKASYLLDLAHKSLDGTVRLDRIGNLSDDAIIVMLTKVKGIGRWTAEMFLIFSLGRPDVLPVDDLGVRVVIKDLYGLNQLPDKATCLEIAAPWRPYATMASWYCWRSLDLKRTQRASDFIALIDVSEAQDR